MESLIEQLLTNTVALESLETRYNYLLLAPKSYYIFHTESQRIATLEWVIKVRKRVLRMRFRTLENIHLNATKQMQHASTQMRQLNLKEVA